MGELTFGEFAAFLALWTLAVAVVVDLVWCRPVRVKLRKAEGQNRRLNARLDRVERGRLVRPSLHHPSLRSASAARRRRRSELRVVRGGETA